MICLMILNFILVVLMRKNKSIYGEHLNVNEISHNHISYCLVGFIYKENKEIKVCVKYL